MAKPVRFLHIADLHLGAKLATLPPEIAVSKRSALREKIAWVVAEAIRREVDIILIAGDLFDSVHPVVTDINAVRQALRKAREANIQVAIIPGNHDPYAPGNFWEQSGLVEQIDIFFRENTFRSVTLPALDLEVIGVGFDTDQPRQNKLAQFDLTPQTQRSILLLHGGWQEVESDFTQHYPFSTKDLARLPVNYVALGHYHGYQTLPTGGQPVAVYPGDAEGLDFTSTEIGQRSLIFGEIDSAGAVTTEQLSYPGGLMMRTLELDVVSHSINSIDQAVQAVADKSALLQLNLTGVPDVDTFRQLPGLRHRFAGLFAHFVLRDRTIGLPDEGLVEDDRTYQGAYVGFIRKKIDQTNDDQEKKRWERALAVGLAAFDAAKTNG